MELGAGHSRSRPTRIMFNVSDSSLEEISTTPSGNTASVKRFNVELKKHRNDIITELADLTKGMNLAIWIIYGLYSLSWYLIGVQWLIEPNWGLEMHCNIPGLEEANWTFYEKRNFSSPKHRDYNPGCVYYDYPYDKLGELNYEAAQEALKNLPKHPKIIKCKNITIEADVPKEVTHIREFEIFCVKKAVHNSKLYVHIGVSLFGFPTGLLADIYGRRPVNNFCAVVFCISAFVVPLSPNFAIFALATTFLGGTSYLINMLLGVIYSEIFRSKYRGFNTMLAFIWWYLGSSQPDILYNVMEAWRLRNLMFAFSTLIILFSAIMIIPESPRLLSIKRQFRTAWDCLHELGSPKSSDAQNYMAPKIAIKYQLKIFTKSYLLHRLYSVLLLNGVATCFHHVFKYMKRTILKPQASLSMKILVIQVILVLFTGLLMFFYSRKALISIFYILLSLSILTNMLSYSDIIVDVGALAGQDFSAIIYMLTIIYLMEVFPTSHRATSMGVYLTINHLIQSLAKIYIDELSYEYPGEFFSAFYCGICMICALVTVMIPDTSEDMPDRKEDLFLPLSTTNSTLDIITEI